MNLSQQSSVQEIQEVHFPSEYSGNLTRSSWASLPEPVQLQVHLNRFGISRSISRWASFPEPEDHSRNSFIGQIQFHPYPGISRSSSNSSSDMDLPLQSSVQEIPVVHDPFGISRSFDLGSLIHLDIRIDIWHINYIPIIRTIFCFGYLKIILYFEYLPFLMTYIDIRPSETMLSIIYLYGRSGPVSTACLLTQPVSQSLIALCSVC